MVHCWDAARHPVLFDSTALGSKKYEDEDSYKTFVNDRLVSMSSILNGWMIAVGVGEQLSGAAFQACVGGSM